MIFEMGQMEYGKIDSRSANLFGASGCVSVFQNSLSFPLRNISFQG